MELRRLVGRAVETKYKGLNVRCVFSDDTCQRGSMGFVCGTYVGDEKSHRTVYSYHASPTHVAVTTVGPANHRAGESLPASLFSAKFVVAREASWARAFFKPSATAAAEVPMQHVAHQEDVHEILLKYLGGMKRRTVNIASCEVSVVLASHDPRTSITVLVTPNEGSTKVAFVFQSRTWATRPRVDVLTAPRGLGSSFSRAGTVDVNVASRDVKSVLSYVMRTAIPMMATAKVDMTAPRRLK